MTDFRCKAEEVARLIYFSVGISACKTVCMCTIYINVNLGKCVDGFICPIYDEGWLAKALMDPCSSDVTSGFARLYGTG